MGTVLVAIHQPNYVPWFGYFYKMARADYFVFLNDVQFSKHSYTNRVRIARKGVGRWLTQPVRQCFGQKICEVQFADDRWLGKHLDILRGTYEYAAHFGIIWKSIVAMYESIAFSGLAEVNEGLVKMISRELGLGCTFVRSSDLAIDETTGDSRLIELVGKVAPGATYLSGAGGSAYQDPGKFEAAGVPLRYVSFEHPVYGQGAMEFCPGLSILDVVFHLGWDGARSLLVKPQTTNSGSMAGS